MGDGFLPVKTLSKIDIPIVWRFPDMWPMTGGCHYADGCEKFTDGCGDCPQLNRSLDHDITWWTHLRKRNAWSNADITAVAPSAWLAEQAKQSSIFQDRRIEVIPNGLNTDLFKPYDRTFARDVFDIPDDRKIILFGAIDSTSDPRKGFVYLKDAIQSMATDWDSDDIEVIIFGSSEPENPPSFGFDTRYVGYLDDEESLALLYAAAEVMVVPSRYEGFGQTVVEAQACGTPVVAFDATGPSDTVAHGKTGYLATPYEAEDLATGIEWILDGDRAADLGKTARKRAVDLYQLETVAEQYRALYEDLL
jgi:glycosyltransferase involved in cell wall biosynthesis